MANGEPIWSRAFAQKIGGLLGVSAPDLAAWEEPTRNEAEALLAELTEDFRYLPAAQWKWVEDFTRFLADRALDPREVGESQAALSALGRPPTERVGSLREVRSYAAFLRSSHGYAQPADESDEWTDEDRRDIQLAARRRLEEEDPYPWPEDQVDAHAG